MIKAIINSIFLLFTFSIFAQNIDVRGHISYKEDNSDFIGVNIYLLKEGVIKFGSTTDLKGNYEIKNIPTGLYDIRLNFLGFKDKYIPNYIINSETKILDFEYPNSCKATKKFCPYGHKDNLIPIVYGLPRSTKLIKKAEKGKIKLGGCVISNCDPKWFCKIHNLEF